MGALARCSWVTLAHTLSFSYAHSVTCAKTEKHTDKCAVKLQIDKQKCWCWKPASTQKNVVTSLNINLFKWISHTHKQMYYEATNQTNLWRMHTYKQTITHEPAWNHWTYPKPHGTHTAARFYDIPHIQTHTACFVWRQDQRLGLVWLVAESVLHCLKTPSRFSSTWLHNPAYGVNEVCVTDCKQLSFQLTGWRRGASLVHRFLVRSWALLADCLRAAVLHRVDTVTGELWYVLLLGRDISVRQLRLVVCV